MRQAAGEAKQSTRRGGPVCRNTCKPSMSSYARMNSVATMAFEHVPVGERFLFPSIDEMHLVY